MPANPRAEIIPLRSQRKFNMENAKPSTPTLVKSPIRYTIMPDYPDAYAWENKSDDHSLGGCIADSGSPGAWVGKIKISKSLMRRFDQWHPEFRNLADKELENRGQQDWSEFHRQGISLAKAVKAEMGSKARVFYEKPSEDLNCHIDERVEILEGGGVVVFRRVGHKGRNFEPVADPTT
jgi:hypothetical protein